MDRFWRKWYQNVANSSGVAMSRRFFHFHPPTHAPTHAYPPTYAPTHIHTHAHTHTHIHMHTYTHTHTQIPRVSALNLSKYLFKKIKREIFGKIDISQTTRDQEFSFGTKVVIHALCRFSDFRPLISVNIYLKKSIMHTHNFWKNWYFELYNTNLYISWNK